MILTKIVKIKITHQSYEYYKKLGYDVDNKIIDVKVEDLQPRSKTKIQVKCDYCGTIKESIYANYNVGTKNCTQKYACISCAHVKGEATLMKKHGVKNCSQIKEVREKRSKDFHDEQEIERMNVINDIFDNNINIKQKFINFVKSTIVTVDNYIIDNNCFDLFIPDSNIMIDFIDMNKKELISEYKEKRYVYDKIKSDICIKNKIKLIVVYCDDWIFRDSAIKTLVLYNLGETYANEYKEKTGEYLPLSSNKRIKIKCEFCNNVNNIVYSQYNENTKNNTLKYACSITCAHSKYVETVNTLYNVDNVSQIQSVKEQKIKTCQENHGVNYPQQSKEIFAKSKATKKEKYGDEFYFDDEKRAQTCIERFGSAYPQSTDGVKAKQIETMYINDRARILEEHKDEGIIDYTRDGLYVFKCDCGCEHTFEIPYKLKWHRLQSNTILCTKCNPIDKHTSGMETQFQNFIRSVYDDDIITNTKRIINPLELDVYLPNLNLAFEFNGLHWHGDSKKENDYHKIKSDRCDELGIQLIHIWEDDWIYRREIIESYISGMINKYEIIINADDTILKNVDNDIAIEFLKTNHILGSSKTDINYGLYYNDELVSLMSFKKLKNNNYELIRYCNKLNTNIIGDDKLFKYFTKNNSFNEISSHADRSYSNCDMLKSLGFKITNLSEPYYFYVIGNKRINKNKFTKELLIEDNVSKIYNSGIYSLIYKNEF